jgi:hypothetical protein
MDPGSLRFLIFINLWYLEGRHHEYAFSPKKCGNVSLIDIKSHFATIYRPNIVIWYMLSVFCAVVCRGMCYVGDLSHFSYFCKIWV